MVQIAETVIHLVRCGDCRARILLAVGVGTIFLAQLSIGARPSPPQDEEGQDLVRA